MQRKSKVLIDRFRAVALPFPRPRNPADSLLWRPPMQRITRRRTNRQSGQAMTEYIILVVALFIGQGSAAE